MNLTIKDIWTTLLTAATIGTYYGVVNGLNMPFISGYRAGIIVLAIIGVAMCALSGRSTTAGGIFVTLASILGAGALLLILYGLITGAKLAFVLLALDIIVLWIISTIRHAVTP
jgi:hypothetical protein